MKTTITIEFDHIFIFIGMIGLITQFYTIKIREHTDNLKSSLQNKKEIDKEEEIKKEKKIALNSILLNHFVTLSFTFLLPFSTSMLIQSESPFAIFPFLGCFGYIIYYSLKLKDEYTSYLKKYLN